MALRDVVGTAAKMSAGFWSEVAKLAEPASSGAAPRRPEAPARAEAKPAAEEPPETPDGVLVPIDTWTRVMDQLGNLHRAGQDLAEARERAARAETQVAFLKQQLADEKAKRAKPSPPAPEPSRQTDTQKVAETQPEPEIRTGARSRVTNARNRVSVWLSTD